MPVYTVWMLEEASISISPPAPGGRPGLDGVTQGDGSHLLNRQITLNNGNFLRTLIEDNILESEDNDTTQSLAGQQTVDGVTYASGTGVEAEYRLILRDPTDPSRQWTVYGYNVSNSNPAFATVEGLAFRPAADGSFPPIGRPLNVVLASEGPWGPGTNPCISFAEPPCFTPCTLIDTPGGPRGRDAGGG